MQVGARMFRWDDAKILLALEREGSLSGAARRLAVDATTVGRRLAALEDALGQRLFERTPDGAVATALAEELVAHAESMEQAAHAMAGSVAGFERGVEGTIRLSVPPGLSDILIAPRLIDLRARHPRLDVELDARIGYVNLARREADLALRGIRPERGDLVSVRLTTSRSIPFASATHAEELGNVRDASELPWITYGAELDHIPDAAWVLQVATSSSFVLRTSSFSSQVAATVSGLGVMLGPRELMRDVPALAPVSFTRRERGALPPFPEGALYLVAHRSMRRVPRVAAVWDFLVEQFE